MKKQLLLAIIASSSFITAKQIVDVEMMPMAPESRDQAIKALRARVKQALSERKEWHALKKQLHSDKQALKKTLIENKVKWVNDLVGRNTAQELNKSLHEFDKMHKQNRAAWKQLMETYQNKIKDLAQRQEQAEAVQK